uniref:Mevalonate kinase n=1 Tax=Clastoptera arizonana TaxID=38151 RepID=A0A1B6C337_9HEMI
MSNVIKFRLSTPGKVILFGEHGVVHNRTAIATSINKRTYLKFTETENDYIEFNLPQINLVQKFKVCEMESLLDKGFPIMEGKIFCLSGPSEILHDQFIKNICEYMEHLNINPLTVQQTSAIKSILYLLIGLLSTVNMKLKGFTIELSSQISIGAGMGSSASFAVSLAAAIIHYIRCYFKLNYSGSVNISKGVAMPYMLELDEHSLDFSKEFMEMINNWAFGVEKIMHGSPSGLDNTVCTFGYLIEMNRKDKVGDEKFHIVYSTPELRVLMVDTGVSRVTVNLVNKVATLKSNHPQIIEYVLNAMGETAQKASNTLQKFNRQSNFKDQLQTFKVLEELVDINQGLLKTLGVSHSLLDTICELSSRFGLHSKLTGAGGGGYAFTLVPPNFDDWKVLLYCDALLKEAGLKTIDVTLGTHGVRLES